MRNAWLILGLLVTLVSPTRADVFGVPPPFLLRQVAQPAAAAVYLGLGNVSLSSATVKAYYSCANGYTTASSATGTEKACKYLRNDAHTCDGLIATNGVIGLTANCSTGGDNGQTLATWLSGHTAVINTFYDHTGNGFDALGTAASVVQPGFSLTGGPASQAVSTFNGTTQCALGSNPSVSAGSGNSTSFYWVANRTFNSTFALMIDLDNSGQFVGGNFNTSNKVYSEAGAGFVSGTAADGAWNVVSASLTGTTGSTLNVNGTVIDTQTTNSATSVLIAIGCFYNGGSLQSLFDGSVGEVAVMSGPLNSTDQTNLFNNAVARGW